MDEGLYDIVSGKDCFPDLSHECRSPVSHGSSGTIANDHHHDSRRFIPLNARLIDIASGTVLAVDQIRFIRKKEKVEQGRETR